MIKVADDNADDHDPIIHLSTFSLSIQLSLSIPLFVTTDRLLLFGCRTVSARSALNASNFSPFYSEGVYLKMDEYMYIWMDGWIDVSLNK